MVFAWVGCSDGTAIGLTLELSNDCGGVKQEGVVLLLFLENPFVANNLLAISALILFCSSAGREAIYGVIALRSNEVCR